MSDERGVTRLSVEQRFWAKVDRRGSDECWMWLTGGNPKGYGCFWYDGRTYEAHRFAYLFLVGPIPEGLCLDHLCRNRRCVNPAHLEVVTLGENVLRGVCPAAENARKTHCRQGHPLSGDNLSITKARRRCRTCHRANQAAYLARKACDVE